jgi:hypothetical protein
MRLFESQRDATIPEDVNYPKIISKYFICSIIYISYDSFNKKL